MTWRVGCVCRRTLPLTWKCFFCAATSTFTLNFWLSARLLRLFPISASLLITHRSRLFPDTYVLCGAYYAGMFNGEGIVNGINSPNLITFGTYVLAIQYCVSTDPPGRIRVRAGSLSARVSGDVSDMCTECMCACVPWVCDSDSKTHLTRSGTLSHLLLRRTATASVRQPPLMLWSYLRTCGLQYVVLIGSCQSLASLRSSVGCSEPCSTRSTKSSRYRHIQCYRSTLSGNAKLSG